MCWWQAALVLLPLAELALSATIPPKKAITLKTKKRNPLLLHSSTAPPKKTKSQLLNVIPSTSAAPSTTAKIKPEKRNMPYHQKKTVCNPKGEGIVGASCPRDWHDAGAGLGCFLMDEFGDAPPLTFDGAQKYCSERGGFLAEPRCKVQWEFLQALSWKLNHQEKVQFWIGLSDRRDEGQFRWVRRRDKAELFYWSDHGPAGEKDGDPERFNCVYADGDDEFRWKDDFCQEKKKPLCQQWRSHMR